MVKVHLLWQRKPGLTHEQSVDHWLRVHAPMVRESGIGKQYVRKYINCDINACLPDGAPEYDGIAEMWFDTREDFEAFFAHEEFASKVGLDASKFCDMPNLRIFVTEENPCM